MPTGNRPVSPRTIFGTSLELWLRADLGITLNVGNVSAWADQSGKGDVNRNCLQGTAASQPTFVASDAGLNGRPSVSFPAGGTQLSLVSGTWAPAPSQPFTVFLAAKASQTGAANQYALDSIIAGTQMAVFTTAHAQVTAFATGSLQYTTDTTVKAVSVYEFNGVVNSKIYWNALTAVATGNAGPNIHTGTTIGNYAGLLAVTNFDGTIAEVIYVSGIATLAQRTACMTYLGARYLVTIGA